MTKRIIAKCLLLSFAVCSFGQKPRFTQVVEQMYFNVLDRNPDKQIQPFVKKYFPAFLGWNKDENAGWAYTLKANDISRADRTMHSFIFTKHPLVKTKYIYGKLDFETYEMKAGKPLISGWTLYFSFDNYNDAITCFDNIYSIFDTLSIDRTTFTKSNRRVAQLTNYDKLSDSNCVELVLVNDELYDDRYKLYFYYGRQYHSD